MPTWDDKQYLRFVEQRTRPAAELLARVQLDSPSSAPTRVVDLGCGPGNSSVLLRERWPQAHVVGVDNSPEMLARARADYPTIEFVAADAASYDPGEAVDVVFANALLQWLPDHRRLIPHLLGLLRPGGVLAIQMPSNSEQPSHRLMRELGAEWTARFQTLPQQSAVLMPAEYYDLLAPLTNSVDIWTTIYQHVMPSVEAIVEWVKGTGLRPFLEALPASQHGAYLDAYAAALSTAYPPRADGRRLFPFPRLFVVATR
jgi:trans-aconitate 2-methyltransferase